MKRIAGSKLALQSTALLLATLATVPIYLGLQGGVDALAWFGLLLTVLGMALGLWVS